MKTSSVLISTYNRPHALQRVLEGLSQQALPADEIIIGDDGSTPETKVVIDRWCSAGLPIQHCWHEDKGYRKTIIMNRAIQVATSDVLIFLDGDCVPLASFVRDHIEMHEQGCIHAGPRMLASPRLTAHIERHGIESRSIWFWVRARINRDINRLAPLIRLPDGPWRRRTPHKWELVRGCNFSVARQAVLAIDGFEGALFGWGPDDSDMAVRLINNGMTVKSLRFAAPVVHLWHREEDRGHLQENLAYLQAALRERRTLARAGLSSLSA
jgi:glycosyltransferase involved in cell wall biosynthesis